MAGAALAQPPAFAALIRLARREPTLIASSNASGVAALETSQIGFAGAAEDDRRRWLNSFRRLVDGLESPLQVVIKVRPGQDDSGEACGIEAATFQDLRGADLCFVDEIRRDSSSHTVTTSLITTEKQAPRVSSA